MPSGRNAGQQCEVSPSDGSSSVAGSTPRPSPPTRNSPAHDRRPARIRSCPRRSTFRRTEIVRLRERTGAPPFNATFINRPLAKNPSDALSGDQNGCAASSVPGIGYGVNRAADRAHRADSPSRSFPTNAMCRPSGETIGAEPRPIPGGSGHVNRVNSGACPSREGTRVKRPYSAGARARQPQGLPHRTTLGERHRARLRRRSRDSQQCRGSGIDLLQCPDDVRR